MRACRGSRAAAAARARRAPRAARRAAGSTRRRRRGRRSRSPPRRSARTGGSGPVCGRSRRKKLDRYQSFTGCGQLVHAVLEVGAAHRRGALGAQRERLAAAVVEGVHLLLHDVGGLPHAAREQLGGLERRRLDPRVAGALEDPRARRPRARRARARRRPARRTCRAGPGSSGSRRSSCRNGLLCALAAERRRAHVAGQHPRLVGQRLQQRGDRVGSSVGVSPPGRSVRPTEPWNSTSPEKIACSAGIE